VPPSLSDLPTDRAIRVEGARPDAIALSTDPLPAKSPAILRYSFAARLPRSRAETVVMILHDLEAAAIEMFPAWLPEAADVDTLAGAGAAALRAAAFRLASRSSHFGPYLVEVALRAGDASRRHRSLFRPEIRATGLARIMATSFDRSRAVLLITVPDGLDPQQEQALATACEWLADRDRFGVWLTGAPLQTIDWLESIPVHVSSATGDASGQSARTRPVDYPPMAGFPHPGSQVEQRLERALKSRPWATGRVWNQVMSLGSLINPVQPDLVWPTERCVVELDGDDHHNADKYARDRARDVELQLAGYAVLRFTNRQISNDLEAVLTKLHRFLKQRRTQIPADRPNHPARGETRA
jgi:very-short-patch-repair endonuclease